MRIYRKILIVVILLTSLIITDKIIKDNTTYGGKDLVEAFGNTQFRIENTELNIWGEYIPKYMVKEEMCKVVEEVALKLGIENYHEDYVDVKDKKVYTIEKSSKDAHTKIQLVEIVEGTEDGTFKARNYLTVNIKLYNKYKSVGYFEKKLGKLYDEMDIVATKGLIITASQHGEISQAVAEEVMESMVYALKGEIKSIVEQEQLKSAYAYSKYMEDYVVTNGEKINMDLAITYNEIEEKTYFYVATPVITFEY
ncbi:MAG: hypothetical protein CVV02_06365 [Firmicutes bacterium HGW-Firmicutes-7]|nr:MAG: hypothetical protein CVV02_06365 [Firmicutes bacterium HGW-Firmicutes-7]